MELECLPTHAIVEILQTDHDKIFYKEIPGPKGEKIRLTLTFEKSRDKDEHFSQGVHLAKIVAVGDEIDSVKPGDVVMVDYTVDTGTARILFNDGERKLVDVIAKNVYHEDDYLLSATNERPRDTYIWRKGDLDEITVIFGIVKDDGEVIPLDPFVILEYAVVDGTFEENENGILVPVYEGDAVMRRCLFAHENSRIKQGDTVLVPFDSLYEREVYDKVISVCIEKDILSTVRFEAQKSESPIIHLN
jgi:hypothetical protein